MNWHPRVKQNILPDTVFRKAVTPRDYVRLTFHYKILPIWRSCYLY